METQRHEMWCCQSNSSTYLMRFQDSKQPGISKAKTELHWKKDACSVAIGKRVRFASLEKHIYLNSQQSKFTSPLLV